MIQRQERFEIHSESGPKLLMTAHRLISSRDNPKFKRWQRLLDSKGIKKEKQFIIFGERVIQEILEEHPKNCLELIYPGSWPATLPCTAPVSSYTLESTLFKQLDIFGTQAPLLVCEVPSIPQWNSQEPPKDLEVMCPVGDPSNMGAILRSCQAFGVHKVILLQEAVSPFHPKSVRSASGAVLNINFSQGPSIKDLWNKEMTSSIVALDVSGNDITRFQWPRNVQILIGEEGQGLSGKEFLNKVSIPMTPGMHSFNAGISVSIGMYAYRLQRPLSHREDK